jgi:ubiquinone/menaquinone biosynthesis C-methylase UbiE
MNTIASHMSLAGPEPQDLTNEISVLQKMLKFDTAKVLELGCGAAEKTRMIADNTNVDSVIAAEVDAIAHQKNLATTDLEKVTFKAYGAEAIEEPDQSIDIVLMFKSLHHVPLDQLDGALLEIHRVLKPGGFAYISEPVFAGKFNDILQVYHNEQVVRQAAFDAISRCVTKGLFHLESEYFFQNRIQLASWDQYEESILDVTHTDHNLSAEQYTEVKKRFLASETDAGFVFDIPNRVDLLRKAVLT